MDLVLSNEFLRLRIVSLEDIPYIWSATRHQGFNDGVLWDPPTSIEELVPPYHSAIEAWKEQRSFNFTMESTDSIRFFGRISIRKTEIQNRLNIGFWTHPTHQGKGIMTAAVGLILAFGFDGLGAQEIEACYATWNHASGAVLRKNGMSFVRYVKEGFMKQGAWVPENIVSITRADWDSQNDGTA
ncbi:MAG: GNAT family N-acetyltransferase [Saprospiraceae bacterium]|nr:GNAT family N-acetyltransferase [Saprospiraceae bacterium]